MKKKPIGFIATCQCGNIVGAMDFERTDRKDAEKILGQWLGDGCTIVPRFGGSWSCAIEACACEANQGGAAA